MAVPVPTKNPNTNSLSTIADMVPKEGTLGKIVSAATDGVRQGTSAAATEKTVSRMMDFLPKTHILRKTYEENKQVGELLTDVCLIAAGELMQNNNVARIAGKVGEKSLAFHVAALTHQIGDFMGPLLAAAAASGIEGALDSAPPAAE